MKKSVKFPILLQRLSSATAVLVAILVAGPLQAEMTPEVEALQQRWAEVNYMTKGETQVEAFTTLIEDARRDVPPAVHDACLVGGLQTLGDLPTDIERLVQRQRSALQALFEEQQIFRSFEIFGIFLHHDTFPNAILDASSHFFLIPLFNLHTKKNGWKI